MRDQSLCLHCLQGAVFRADYPMVAPSYSIAPDHGQRNRLAGIASATEAARGWDQGFCVPLKVMVPDAEIPLVPISLGNGLDPAAYLAIRWALKPLRDEGVLLLGSGQTYYNMRDFFDGRAVDPKAEAFDTWLRSEMIDGETRNGALIRRENAPGARDA